MTTTTRITVFQFRLNALAAQARAMASKLENIADRGPIPTDASERELRAIEDSFDVVDRLRIRDLEPPLKAVA